MAKRSMMAGRIARAGLRLVAILLGLLVVLILSGGITSAGILWSDIDDKEDDGDADETKA